VSFTQEQPPSNGEGATASIRVCENSDIQGKVVEVSRFDNDGRFMRKKIAQAPDGLLTQPIPFDAFSAPSIFGRNFDPDSAPFALLMQERLDALCASFGVDPLCVNRHHALTLARRYVRGFQIDRRNALRSRKWDDLRLAQLWLLFRAARPSFSTDRLTAAFLAKQNTTRKLTGRVKPIWVEQLLDKARLSPLVQMLESSNPNDVQFARTLVEQEESKVRNSTAVAR
jgi:hypothetical protein